MIKQYLLIFLALACTAFSWGQRGLIFQYDQLYYKVLSEEDRLVALVENANLCSDGNYSGAIIVPDSVEYDGVTYSVVELEEFALSFTLLDKVTLPSTLRRIKGCAFVCSQFSQGLSIPDGVEVIGASAFQQTRGLTTLYLPASLRSIDRSAFYMSQLQTVDVCEENPYLCSIDNVIFSKDTTTLYCVAGTISANYVVPEKVRVIKDWAFMKTPVQQITLPDSLREIGVGVFYECPLQSLRIPQLVSKLGSGPVAKCESLTSLSIDPRNTHYRMGSDSVSIYSMDGDTLFSFHDSNISLTFAEGVKVIGGLSCNYGIGDVVVPEGVTTLLDDAFAGSGLTSLSLPRSLRTVATGALSHLNIPNTIYPSSIAELGEEVWAHSMIESFILPDSVKVIPARTLYGSMVTDLQWNEAVEYIGSNAFNETWIEEFDITSRVHVVGDSAFGYTNASSQIVTFHYPVDTIGIHCFMCVIPTVVTLVNRTPPVMNGYSIFMRNGFSNATIRIPCGSLQAYLDDPRWGRYEGHYEEYECESVDEAEIQPALAAHVEGRALTLLRAGGLPVEIYDAMGRLVLRDNSTGDTRYYTLPHSGLYIVRTPQGSLKVIAD